MLLTRRYQISLVSMPADAKSKYAFRKLLEDLEGKRGQGTELISVYIPPDFEMAKVLTQLREEQGTASNIKSKTTRKNVMAALERIIQFLRTYIDTNRKPPPNGMAIFSGNVAGRSDYVDIQLYWIEPPEPVTTRMYRCDQQFVTEPLKEMIQIKETIGMLLLDGKEATVSTLRGKHVEVLRRMTSGTPGKHGKGGQSAKRFERLHEIAVHEYHKRVAEEANEIFSTTPDMKIILVGGPGPTKEDFLKEELLRTDVKNKIAGVFDTGYTDEQGIKEVVNRAGKVLANLEVMKEKYLMQRFMEELVAGKGLVAYGEKDIRKALGQGAVEILLISENYKKKQVRVKCQGCGKEFIETVDNVERYEKQLGSQPCPNCGQTRLSLIESKDLVQELLDISEKFNTRVEFISTESEEGSQLEMAFKGLAAILRFRIS